ncbi:MAG: response regulator [Sediminispirochaetaceae bacterium]
MAKSSKKIRIFSALEVANICGVVNQTAINWIKNNHLKAFTTPGGQYRIYADDLYDFLESRSMRIPDELQEIRGARRKKILVIDDDEELNKMVADVISDKLSDFEVYQAFDGFEAGRIISEEKPNVIILDIDLPGIDGHTLCKKIKNDKSLGSPVIISISGLDEESEGEKILEEGADAFFSKPLELEDILGSIKDLSMARS